MKSTCFLLLSIFLLLPVYTFADSQQFLPLELPNWFLTMPLETDYAIGISATSTYNPESTATKIKEKASVLACRNKSAIVIAKLKMRENQTVPTPFLSNFRLQLTDDIDYLKKYYNSAKIITSSQLYGMTLALVGQDSIQVDETIQTIKKPPVWYKDNAYSQPDQSLISGGKASSENMSKAYHDAYQNAVYNLIQGIKPRVQSAMISSPNYTEKFVEIDASLIIENMRNTRNSLVLRKCGNSFVYDAYVEIIWQPQLNIQNMQIKE